MEEARRPIVRVLSAEVVLGGVGLKRAGLGLKGPTIQSGQN